MPDAATPGRVKRLSAKALVLDRDRLLVVVKRDEAGPYYVIPGGGQDWGETLDATIARECLEETGTSVRAGPLVCVREYLGARQDFPNANRNLHQVELYFACSPSDEPAAAPSLPDSRQTGVEWLPLDALDGARLYPSAIKPFVRALAAGSPLPPCYVGPAD